MSAQSPDAPWPPGEPHESGPPGEQPAPPPEEENPYRFGPPGPNPFGYPSTPPQEHQQQPSYPPPYGQTPYPAPQHPPPYGQPPPGQPPYGQPRYPYPPPGSQYPPPGSQYPPPGSQYPAPGAQPGNGRATAGLALGVGSLLLCWLTILDAPIIVLGVVFSGLGLSAARRGAPGRGRAIAGLVCSIVAAAAATALFIFFLHRYEVCVDRYGSGTSAFDHCLRTGN